MPTMRIENRFRGLAGRGQGGYTAGLLAGFAGGPTTVALLAPPPLEVDMEIETVERGLELRHEDQVIAKAERDTRPMRDLAPVHLIAAENATRRFPGSFHHDASGCFSCGTEPGTFGVHVGPTEPRGTYATPWTPPAWTAPNGYVEEPFVWTASDCAAGWRAGNEPEPRLAVTAWIRTEVIEPLLPEVTYIVASWSDPWDGRKCLAGAHVFGQDGTVVARSESFWISVE